MNSLYSLYGESSSIETVNVDISGIFWENPYWESRAKLEKKKNSLLLPGIVARGLYHFHPFVIRADFHSINAKTSKERKQ